MEFSHLHTHSIYSAMDGICSVETLVRTAKDMGMPAIALTDHLGLYGAIELFKYCKKYEVKPIIGCEINLAEGYDNYSLGTGGLFQNRQGKVYHLTLLATNIVGYKNLMQISKRQFGENSVVPHVDKRTLAQYADGVICLSGCIKGELAQNILGGNDDDLGRLSDILAWYLDVYGDRFYIELQGHNSAEYDQVNRVLVELAQKWKIKTVITNNVHYINKQDAQLREILHKIKSGDREADIQVWGTSDVDNVDHDEGERRRAWDASYHFATADEMQRIAAQWDKRAFDNVGEIVGRCEAFQITQPGVYLPTVFGDNEQASRSLREICYANIHKKYPNEWAGKADRLDEIRRRLDYELEVIHKTQFAPYFMIINDLVQFASQNNIIWNVRGSASSSLVAYLLGLTQVDPIKYGLLFERFLNPERANMPDIDIDFSSASRAKIVEYTIERYGVEQVVQMISFKTIGQRGAIRDVARVLGFDFNYSGKISNLVSRFPDVSLAEMLNDERSPLAMLCRDDANALNVCRIAAQIGDAVRSIAPHPAGVIIADRPVDQIVPVIRIPNKGISDQIKWMTQFDVNSLEPTGLLKMDYLGLKTLDVIQDAVALIRERRDPNFNLNMIDIEDEAIYQLLAKGDVIGLFQVESDGMRNMLMEMKPKNYIHIMAALALYRPATIEYLKSYTNRMNGIEPVSYLHADLSDILKETYGICVYQEQVMLIARKFAGYSMGEADMIRKAVSKKNAGEMAMHRSKFIEGALKNNYSEADASRIFDAIEKFAGYGFPKAHAASYAVITCQTAWLKAHYPVEYFCAMMKHYCKDDSEYLARLIAGCFERGIRVLPPDINKSQVNFSISDEEPNAILFGLTGIKGIGEEVAASIVHERQKNGPFRSLDDLRGRIRILSHKKTASSLFEKLALSGGLDAFVDEIPEELRPTYESQKELLSFPFVPHEFQSWRERIAQLDRGACFVSDLSSKDVEQMTIWGCIEGVERFKTRKGDTMVIISVSDGAQACRLAVYPNTLARQQRAVRAGNIVRIRAKKNRVSRPNDCAYFAESFLFSCPMKSDPDFVLNEIKSSIGSRNSATDVMRVLNDIRGDERQGERRVLARDGAQLEITQATSGAVMMNDDSNVSSNAMPIYVSVGSDDDGYKLEVRCELNPAEFSDFVKKVIQVAHGMPGDLKLRINAYLRYMHTIELEFNDLHISSYQRLIDDIKDERVVNKDISSMLIII